MWHFSSVSVMSEWPVTPTKCWLSVFCSFALRLVKCVKKLLSGLVCECDSCFVEIGGNVCKQRIPVLHDDGSIEALPLDGGAGRAYGEAVGLGRLLALYLNFVGSNLVYAVDLKRLHTVADVVC